MSWFSLYSAIAAFFNPRVAFDYISSTLAALFAPPPVPLLDAPVTVLLLDAAPPRLEIDAQAHWPQHQSQGIWQSVLDTIHAGSVDEIYIVFQKTSFRLDDLAFAMIILSIALVLTVYTANKRRKVLPEQPPLDRLLEQHHADSHESAKNFWSRDPTNEVIYSPSQHSEDTSSTTVDGGEMDSDIVTSLKADATLSELPTAGEDSGIRPEVTIGTSAHSEIPDEMKFDPWSMSDHEHYIVAATIQASSETPSPVQKTYPGDFDDVSASVSSIPESLELVTEVQDVDSTTGTSVSSTDGTLVETPVVVSPVPEDSQIVVDCGIEVRDEDEIVRGTEETSSTNVQVEEAHSQSSIELVSSLEDVGQARDTSPTSPHNGSSEQVMDEEVELLALNPSTVELVSEDELEKQALDITDTLPSVDQDPFSSLIGPTDLDTDHPAPLLPSPSSSPSSPVSEPAVVEDEEADITESLSSDDQDPLLRAQKDDLATSQQFSDIDNLSECDLGQSALDPADIPLPPDDEELNHDFTPYAPLEPASEAKIVEEQSTSLPDDVPSTALTNTDAVSDVPASSATDQISSADETTNLANTNTNFESQDVIVSSPPTYEPALTPAASSPTTRLLDIKDEHITSVPPQSSLPGSPTAVTILPLSGQGSAERAPPVLSPSVRASDLPVVPEDTFPIPASPTPPDTSDSEGNLPLEEVTPSSTLSPRADLEELYPAAAPVAELSEPLGEIIEDDNADSLTTVPSPEARSVDGDDTSPLPHVGPDPQTSEHMTPAQSSPPALSVVNGLEDEPAVHAASSSSATAPLDSGLLASPLIQSTDRLTEPGEDMTEGSSSLALETPGEGSQVSEASGLGSSWITVPVQTDSPPTTPPDTDIGASISGDDAEMDATRQDGAGDSTSTDISDTTVPAAKDALDLVEDAGIASRTTPNGDYPAPDGPVFDAAPRILGRERSSSLTSTSSHSSLLSVNTGKPSSSSAPKPQAPKAEAPADWKWTYRAVDGFQRNKVCVKAKSCARFESGHPEDCKFGSWHPPVVCDNFYGRSGKPMKNCKEKDPCWTEYRHNLPAELARLQPPRVICPSMLTPEGCQDRENCRYKKHSHQTLEEWLGGWEFFQTEVYLWETRDAEGDIWGAPKSPRQAIHSKKQRTRRQNRKK